MRRLLLTLVLVPVLAGCALLRPATNQNTNTPSVTPGEVAVLDSNSNIVVREPLSNREVSSPFVVTGRARVFEGTVLLRLRDAQGQIIASGIATADDAGPRWGQFSAELGFEKPNTPIGVLEVYTESAESGAEQDLIRIPLRLADYQRPKVTIYFTKDAGEEQNFDCSVVYPVVREVEYSPQLMVSALGELFLGPSEADAEQGLQTAINATDVKIQELRVTDGIVYVDFNQALQAGIGGSCRVLAIRSQITETLKPFASSTQVIISIDGNTEDILQP